MNFFALMNNVAALYGRVNVCYFGFVQRHAALLNEPARLAVGRTNASRDKRGNYRVAIRADSLFGLITAASERRASHRLRL